MDLYALRQDLYGDLFPCKAKAVTVTFRWITLFSNVADGCEIVAFRFFSWMQCFLSGAQWWELQKFSSGSEVLQSAPVKL